MLLSCDQGEPLQWEHAEFHWENLHMENCSIEPSLSPMVLSAQPHDSQSHLHVMPGMQSHVKVYPDPQANVSQDILTAIRRGEIEC